MYEISFLSALSNPPEHVQIAASIYRINLRKARCHLARVDPVDPVLPITYILFYGWICFVLAFLQLKSEYNAFSHTYAEKKSIKKQNFRIQIFLYYFCHLWLYFSIRIHEIKKDSLFIFYIPYDVSARIFCEIKTSQNGIRVIIVYYI